jgi:hypothetical protein
MARRSGAISVITLGAGGEALRRPAQLSISLGRHQRRRFLGPAAGRAAATALDRRRWR